MTLHPTGVSFTRFLSLFRVRTSYPLNKALIMLCRDEMSERISRARTVTENNVYLTLFEKKVEGIIPSRGQGRVALVGMDEVHN